MKYKIAGKVCAVLPIEEVGAKKFKKRGIVICDNPDSDYPNEIQLEASGELLEKLGGFKKDDEVVIEFFLNGRGWDSPKAGKRLYFNTLKIASIDLKGEAGAGDDTEPVNESVTLGEGEEVADDIPF